MSILGSLLVFMFVLGASVIVLPVLFPSYFFKALNMFLDWVEEDLDIDSEDI